MAGLYQYLSPIEANCKIYATFYGKKPESHTYEKKN